MGDLGKFLAPWQMPWIGPTSPYDHHHWRDDDYGANLTGRVGAYPLRDIEWRNPYFRAPATIFGATDATDQMMATSWWDAASTMAHDAVTAASNFAHSAAGAAEDAAHAALTAAMTAKNAAASALAHGLGLATQSANGSPPTDAQAAASANAHAAAQGAADAAHAASHAAADAGQKALQAAAHAKTMAQTAPPGPVADAGHAAADTASQAGQKALLAAEHAKNAAVDTANQTGHTFDDDLQWLEHKLETAWNWVEAQLPAEGSAPGFSPWLILGGGALAVLLLLR